MEPDDENVPEPVRRKAILTGLVLSIINVIALVADLSGNVTAALNLVGINGAAAYDFFVLRNRVTPNENVALNKKDEQKLLDAGFVPPQTPR